MRLVLVGLALVAGCRKLPDVADLGEALPTVRLGAIKVERVDFEQLEGRFVLDVYNPYPFEIVLADARWRLELGGRPLLVGIEDTPLAVGATGSARVRIPFAFSFAEAFAVAAGARGKDELPYTLDATLAFATPAGSVAVPVYRSGELPALHAPRIRIDALRVERIDPTVAALALDLSIDTDQGAPLGLGTFAWTFAISGVEVGHGRARLGTVDRHAEVSVPLEVPLANVPDELLPVLTEGERATVRLVIEGTVDTPHGPVPLRMAPSADVTPRWPVPVSSFKTH